MNLPFGINNVDDLYDNNENGDGGFYPLGKGVLWHSGIHINGDKNEKFSPIIPGKVVMYRLSKEYKKVDLPQTITADAYKGRFSAFQGAYTQNKKNKNLYDLTDFTQKKEVSDCFVLLEHDLNIANLEGNDSSFKFYTLYMNLEPEGDSKLYDLTGFKVTGNIEKPTGNEHFSLAIIGCPGLDDGKRYFDFVCMLEKPLKDYKRNNEKQFPLFHGMTKSVSLYTRTKEIVTSRKIYLPYMTSYEVLETAHDKGMTAKHISLKSIRIFFSAQGALEGFGYIKDKYYKILKDRYSWISFSGENNPKVLRLMNRNYDERTKTYGTPCDKESQGVEVQYLYDILNSGITSMNQAKVDFVTPKYGNPGCWIDVVYKFWVIDGKSRFSSSGGTFSTDPGEIFDVYDENPFAYSYIEVQDENIDEIKRSITDIRTDCKMEDHNDSRNSFYATSEDKYFVRAGSEEECFKDAYEFSEWFCTYEPEKAGRLQSENKRLSKRLLDWYEEKRKKSGWADAALSVWWRTPFLTWLYLKYVFGNEKGTENGMEGWKRNLILQQYRKVTLAHPLEWDKDAVGTIETRRRLIFDNQSMNEKDVQYLKSIAIVTDLWNGGLDTVFQSKELNFVHPAYFISHLEKCGVFEFNPYEEDIYSDLKNLGGCVNKFISNENSISYDLTQKVVSNPGFAPFLGIGNLNANSRGYAKVNGYFLEEYQYIENGVNKHYGHEGIDFCGVWVSSEKADKTLRSPIHSCLNGVVVKIGNQGDKHYGKHMVISDGNTRLFLLGHLYDYADGIQVGTKVFPGMTVAYVGNTGNCAGKTKEEKKTGAGTHLHLTVYITKDAKEINFSPGSSNKELNKIIWNDERENYITYSSDNATVVNPFNYEEKR